MATYDITNQVQTLLNHGLSAKQIIEGSRIHPERIDINFRRGEFSSAQVWNRGNEDRWNQYYAQTVAKLSPAKTEAVELDNRPMATDRQVNFIMDLLAQGRGEEGGYFSGPADRKGLRNLTRREASAYIESLLGNY